MVHLLHSASLATRRRPVSLVLGRPASPTQGIIHFCWEILVTLLPKRLKLNNLTLNGFFKSKCQREIYNLSLVGAQRFCLHKSPVSEVGTVVEALLEQSVLYPKYVAVYASHYFSSRPNELLRLHKPSHVLHTP